MTIEPITLIVLIFILATTCLFFLRSRLIRVLHWSLQILFPVLLILVLTALFLPQAYTSLADNSLRAWGTYSSLKNIDNGINSIIAGPKDILDGIEDFFNGGNKDGDPEDFSYAETQIYPGLVNGLSGLYRVLVIVVGLVGMSLIVYLSYSTAGAYTSAKLDHKVKVLEARISELEARLIVSQTPAQ